MRKNRTVAGGPLKGYQVLRTRTVLRALTHVHIKAPDTVQERPMSSTITLREQTSMVFWWPLVQGCGVPMPRTEIILLSEDAADGLRCEAYGDRLSPKRAAAVRAALGAVGKAVERIGVPCFLRTDSTSGKHEYERTCYCESISSIPARVNGLVEYGELVDIMGLPLNAIVVRQLLPVAAPFKAFRGLPITRERRYFVQDGAVICHHAYWPPAALDGHVEEPGWRESLDALNRESEEERLLLTEMARKLSMVLPGLWSVDFMQLADGTWQFIDAARGEVSWHPEHDAEDKEGTRT